MGRTLALTKRVDLSDLGEGWDGCYALVKPASYLAMKELLSLRPTDDSAEANVEYALRGVDYAKKNFISGKVRILNDAGDQELVDMEADDLDANRELADRILQAVTGVVVDPKASSTPTPESPTTPEPSTEQ